MSNTSGITPCGHSVLILPDVIEEKTESGIILGTSSHLDREEMAQTEGIVVSVGDNAWKDQPGGKPWCKTGYRVIFAKYAGTMCEGTDEKTYRLLNDLDVKAIKEIE